MLILICLAAVPLGVLAASSPAVAQTSSTTHAVDFEAMVVERMDLAHMAAEDLAAVYTFRFRGQLWTRVEGHRNAVLVCGPADAVEAAQALAGKLDVERPVPQD